MLNIKCGDLVTISGPLCILRKNGQLESFKGKVVRVVSMDIKRCQCDIGLSKLVYIPKSHLQKVA